MAESLSLITIAKLEGQRGGEWRHSCGKGTNRRRKEGRKETRGLPSSSTPELGYTAANRTTRIFCNVDDVGTISPRLWPPRRQRKCDKQPTRTYPHPPPPQMETWGNSWSKRRYAVPQLSGQGKKFHLWVETRDVNCRLGLYTSTFFKRGREGEKAAGIIKVLGKNFINLTDSPRVSGEEGRKASAQEKPPSLPSPLFQLLFLAEWERERVNGRGEHRGQVREPDYVDQVFTANSLFNSQLDPSRLYYLTVL